jgi:glutamate dehydrogenase/leucine dehydrogenase
VLNYSEADNVTNTKLLEAICDILVSSALEGQITLVNAGNIFLQEKK